AFFIALPAILTVGTLGILAIIESMGRGSQAYYWFSGFKILIKILHLLVWQFPKSQQHNHQISSFEMLHPWYIVVVIGGNGIGGRIDSEQYGGLKAIALGKDACQHRHALLRTVFIIPTDQYHMFTL